jgi:hypothetical protein
MRLSSLANLYSERISIQSAGAVGIAPEEVLSNV